jgi:CheY-like chemotaxis protein
MSAVPMVYFIDDSATMREVIKIAFRRENIDVVTYHDAKTALAEIENARPDIVITDVIMPDKDGYDVCQYIKTHPDLANTPVVLMSGVVNRAVAEKAFAVKADELLRKPFQPQDLMARVKQLLKISTVTAAGSDEASGAAATLSGIFDGSAPFPPQPAAPAVPWAAAVAAAAPPAGPAPISPSFSGSSAALAPFAEPGSSPFITAHPSTFSPPAGPVAVPASRASSNADLTKWKVEVQRLEGLIRKLQTELQAEREYCRALEEHVKTLREVD